MRLESRLLAGLLTGQIPPEGLAAAGVGVDSELGTLGWPMAVLDHTDPDFAIVTP